VQPFTLDQAIIAGLLFILGILIGMFFLAGGKWKRRYRAEFAKRDELERENARLAGEVREHEAVRQAAAARPVMESRTVVTETPVRTVPPSDGGPDLIIRRP